MAKEAVVRVKFRCTAFYEIKVGGNDWEFGGMVGDTEGAISKIESLDVEYVKASSLHQLEESIARKDEVILAQRSELGLLRALYSGEDELS